MNEIQSMTKVLKFAGYEVLTTGEALNLRKRLELATNALRAVEWMHDEEGWFCPWCDNAREDGHKPTCQRQAALGVSGE